MTFERQGRVKQENQKCSHSQKKKGFDMRWTKNSLGGTCIFCNTIKKAEKAIAFYLSFGFESYTGSLHQQLFVGVRRHSGFIIIRSSTSDFERTINLPSKPRRKFPREMLVSDDEKSWCRLEVCGKVVGDYPYVTVTEMNTDSFVGWKYAKEIG
jgi:hypothetical protein